MSDYDAYYDKLNERLQDEYNDVITYMTLSNERNDDNGSIFKDIANEEYTHAQLIKNILEKANALKPTDLAEKARDLLLKG